jgi:hypothetical protein
MPKAPKKEQKIANNEPEKASWSKDQQTREYYYDDAHGYEVYTADEEEPDEEEKENAD